MILYRFPINKNNIYTVYICFIAHVMWSMLSLPVFVSVWPEVAGTTAKANQWQLWLPPPHRNHQCKLYSGHQLYGIPIVMVHVTINKYTHTYVCAYVHTHTHTHTYTMHAHSLHTYTMYTHNTDTRTCMHTHIQNSTSNNTTIVWLFKKLLCK